MPISGKRNFNEFIVSAKKGLLIFVTIIFGHSFNMAVELCKPTVVKVVLTKITFIQSIEFIIQACLLVNEVNVLFVE